MNNNIQESYCSREVMNLLLKHGFNVVCDTPIPTHSIAIEWIRVNFGIWIYSFLHVENEFYWSIIGEQEYTSDNSFSTPQEATDAALLYVLQNLIQ